MAKRIETERLILEPVTEGSLNDLHAIWMDPQASSWSLEPIKSFEESRERHQYLLSRTDSFYWTVHIKESSSPVGFILFSPNEETNEIFGVPTIDIGYSLTGNVWRHGYATEGCKAGMEFVAGKTAPIKITAWVNPNNAASLKVAEKLGMVVEKTYRGDKGKLFLGGEWREDECFLFAKNI